MDSQKANEFFDSYYFAHCCGEPYERSSEWLTLFDQASRRLLQELQPQTVLDAGCAKGFFVEMLRKRGIEAYGVDISEYAISEVDESIKPYCWVGSVAEPFPQRYDLIVCIEVLEHMTQWEAEKAVENLCAHADDIIFSSTPFDYREATHFNVHSPEYWSSLFARHGFFRDVDFDATFITPWSIRFQRRKDALPRIIRDYERKYWLLWKENFDLRSLTVELQGKVALGEEAQEKLDEAEKRVNEAAQEVEHQWEVANQRIHEAAQELAHHQEEMAHQVGHYRHIASLLNAELTQKEQAIVHLSAQLAEARRLSEISSSTLIAEREQALASIRGYTEDLEAALAQKNEHIAHLQDVIRQIEAGNVMRLMKTVQTARNEGVGAVMKQLRDLRRQNNLTLPQPTPTSPTDIDPYQAWIVENEPTAVDLLEQQQHAQSFPTKPLISIITPVYNPPPDVLCDTIESVLAQTYGRWEFCIADASTNPVIKQLLQQYSQRDSRIRVIYLAENQGISGNSNEALKMAQGDYISLLDHDDLLAPNMMYEVVNLLNQDTNIDIVYYDEDKISEDATVRRDPLFKPHTWSPDHLLGTNFLMHSVIRRSLLNEIGGFNPAMDGAQDWDVALRCVEKTENIRHIPKILYHWRLIEGSVARDARSKPWAYDAQPRCIAAHLKRTGVEQPKITCTGIGEVRIIWPTFDAHVSIIIPTKDKVEVVRACVTSVLEKTHYPHYEIILMDTGSSDPETWRYYETLADEPRVQIHSYEHPSRTFNFSAVNNAAIPYASGEVFLFLNNDTEVLHADWLDELVGWAMRPKVGVVGCKLLRPDQTIQHAGLVLGLAGHGSHIFDGDREKHFGPFGSPEWYHNYMAVTGACMMMRREVFEELGGFDEVYDIGYSDIQLCIDAVRGGYRVTYTPFARVLHHEGSTRGFSVPPADVLRGYICMLPFIQRGDPFFNPNLSLVHRKPSVRRRGEISGEEHVLEILRVFDLLNPKAAGLPSEALGNIYSLAHQMMEHDETLSDPDLDNHILLVSHDLSLSGAPMILCMLAKYLKQQGYEVTVVSPSDGPLHMLYNQEDIEVVIEPAAMYDARVTLMLLRDHGAVLVNTITMWRSVYAARAFRRPSIWWVHEAQFGQQLVKEHPHVAQAFAAADAVLFPSQATANLYHHQTRDNVHAIHSGLDLTMLENVINTFERQEGKFYVMNVGSVEPRKGQDTLVKSIQSLPPEIAEQCEWYFVGRVMDWGFYQELAKATRRMKNVHFVGEVAYDRIASYLQSADVFVLPSRNEALPISMLEAMHYGKAVIVSNAGGTREVVEHGVNGFVIDVEDHESLTAHLTTLFNDRDCLRQFGERAKETFDNHLVMSRFGEEVSNLFTQVTEQVKQLSRTEREQPTLL